MNTLNAYNPTMLGHSFIFRSKIAQNLIKPYNTIYILSHLKPNISPYFRNQNLTTWVIAILGENPTFWETHSETPFDGAIPCPCPVDVKASGAASQHQEHPVTAAPTHVSEDALVTHPPGDLQHSPFKSSWVYCSSFCWISPHIFIKQALL